MSAAEEPFIRDTTTRDMLPLSERLRNVEDAQIIEPPAIEHKEPEVVPAAVVERPLSIDDVL
jgi:hypothetical protein